MILQSVTPRRHVDYVKPLPDSLLLHAIAMREVPRAPPGLMAGYLAMTQPKARQRAGHVARLGAVAVSLALSCSMAWATVPQGVWLIDSEAAVQIFDCSNLLWGRILWLETPRNPQGQLDRDKYNPDPALRQRRLCGLTIIWGLHPTGPDRWGGGWFYNPDDGKTYSISAELRSTEIIVARIYQGIRLFGETKTLHRVAHGTSKGWC